jgi:hypothetical protein
MQEDKVSEMAYMYVHIRKQDILQKDLAVGTKASSVAGPRNRI